MAPVRKVGRWLASILTIFTGFFVSQAGHEALGAASSSKVLAQRGPSDSLPIASPAIDTSSPVVHPAGTRLPWVAKVRSPVDMPQTTGQASDQADQELFQNYVVQQLRLIQDQLRHIEERLNTLPSK